MKYIEPEVGIQEEWIEHSEYLGKTFKHHLEIHEEVSVCQCEKCPCVSDDSEWGLSCNISDESIDEYTIKIYDGPRGHGDELVYGSRNCPLVKVITQSKTISPPPKVTAYVVERWFNEVEK